MSTDNAKQTEIIDIEEYAKKDREVPTGHHYKIRIDKESYVVETPTITGRKILALAGKTPEEYLLHQRLRGGGTRTIEAAEQVDLTGRGPERFMTMKRETQEGFTQEGPAKVRRQFKLSATDEAFLTNHYSSWDAVLERDAQWILIRQFPVPQGYSATHPDLAIPLVAGYPEAPLDMAYFSPALSRIDGKEIPKLSPHTFDGQSWQRWSRHRTPANPWTVGEDDISTHISYISFFLAEEFRKRP